MALASVAARRAGGLREAAEAMGLPLPGPDRWEARGEVGAIWLGPDQWLVEAPLATHEDVAAWLKPRLGASASVTEQTDAWARLDLRGRLGPVVERLANLDWARFPPGSATRALLEHMGAVVVRRDEDWLSLLVGRSFAGSLHHAAVQAARAAL